MGFSQTVFPNLPALRRQKGISLDTIAAATCIGKRYLEAIERGAFAVLPGGIYDISYIRQYARAVDFDEQELLEYYAVLRGGKTGGSTAPPTEDRSRTLVNVSAWKLRKT